MKKNDCHRMDRRWSAFQDGELCASERRSLEEHLEHCPACQKKYARLQTMWAALEKVTVIEPQPGFRDELMRKITRPQKKKYHRSEWAFKPRWVPAVLSWTACLILGVMVGVHLGGALVDSIGRVSSPPGTSSIDPEAFFYNLDIFSPMPPRTLAKSYIQLASYPREIEP